MTEIVEASESTFTIVVPIEIRRRNGRPKIVLPDTGPQLSDPAPDRPSGAVIKAIARAWDWRRRLDAGEVSTLQEIADAEKVTLPFVSRSIRLAYLSPSVLERILARDKSISVSLDSLAKAPLEAWKSQLAFVFDEDRASTA
jgi:hypothetical protein